MAVTSPLRTTTKHNTQQRYMTTATAKQDIYRHTTAPEQQQQAQRSRRTFPRVLVFL